MPRESTITAAIKKAAEADGWWVMKLHGGPHQLAGVPDLLCIRNGLAVFLEVKQPGKKATALQVQRMAEITARGGSPCYVVTSTREASDALGSYGWERTKTPCKPFRFAGVECRESGRSAIPGNF